MKLDDRDIAIMTVIRLCGRAGQSTMLAPFVVAMLLSSGCHVLQPRPIEVRTQQFSPELIDGQESQIEVGSRRPIIDGIGWVVGIPDKILLWDRRIANHRISEDTVLAMAEYLEQNNLPQIKVRANQYAPIDDWHRLRKNKTVAWPYRYTLGALSIAGEAILPGRIFGGDHYNPFSDTIHLYSDVPAIAFHEGGHAKDFTRRTYKGTYATSYLIFPLWHETLASQDALWHVQEQGDVDRIVEANRILYPAYGTYVGNGLGTLVPAYSLPLYYGSVVAGHINGRALNRSVVAGSPQVVQATE